MSNIEQEIGSALTSETISGDALSALILRVQEAIVASEAESKRCQEAIYNIDVKDPKAEHAAMEEAMITAGRLQTALTRLHRKRTAAESAERLAQWNSEFKALKEERDLLAVELIDTYPALAAKLIDLFSRLNAFEGRLGQLHSARPSSVKDTLLAPELEARGLSRFTRAEASITAQVQLFDLNNNQIWPVPVPRDMSIFSPLPYNPRYSGEWHKVRDEEADARRRESERVFQHYEQMAKERAAREHAEDAEKWASGK